MLPEKIIFVGVIVSLIGTSFYIKDIILGKTKPNRVSWFIWMLAPFIGAFLQFKAGGGLSTLAVFMAGFCSLLVFIASFIWRKNAYWKITSFDIICGCFSILSLILYLFTHRFGISVAFAILSDFLAGFPTIKKSWKFPDTETGFQYLCSGISTITGFLIIKKWLFPIYAFSVYLILFDLTIMFFIYRKKIFRKTKIEIRS